MKKPTNPKEKNLLKGAMRRVFSRSELRRQALASVHVPGHVDPERPRVTKWGICQECHKFIPMYLMEVDHLEPVIPINQTLDDLSWDNLVDNLWCDISNLVPKCKPCHKAKTKAEAKLRKAFKKDRKT